MKTIALTKGHVARIDDEDYESVSEFRWIALAVRNTVYAVRRFKRGDGSWATEYLHRRLMNAPKGALVDHINHNGLDNTRSNLRLATHSQNATNSRTSSANTSGYRGVSWDKAAHKWKADIRVSGKHKHLGLYADPIEAAKARDKAAIEHHGEYASLNFDLDKEAA